MIWKNTWYLMLVTGGLFAFIWFYEKDLGKEPEAEVKVEQVLPALEAPAVSAIEYAGTNVVRVQRTTAGNWDLTSPIQYPAERLVIEALLKGCAELKAHTTIPDSKVRTTAGGLAEYGLEPPQAIIVFHQPEKTVEFRVGSRTPDQEFFYAQVPGIPGVQIVPAKILELMPTPVNLWRDRALIHLGTQTFDRIEVKAEAGGFELARKADNNWQIVKPPPMKRADNFRAQQLVQLLTGWPVEGFVNDEDSVDLERLGFKPPQAELILSNGTNEVYRVQFGFKPTDNDKLVLARSMKYTNVVLVPSGQYELLRLPFAEFRDRQVLSFNPDQVDRIEINGIDDFAVTRTGNQWVVPGPTNTPADTVYVRQFMTNLASLRVVADGWIKDVVADADYARYGLEPPRAQFTLLSTVTNATGSVTNRIVAQLAVGTAYQSDKVLVRRTDEDSVYAVPLGDVIHLPRNGFEFRKRDIWTFDYTNVVRVQIEQYGRTNTVRKNERGTWELAPGSSGSLVTAGPEGGLITTLYSLGRLQAESWVDIGTNNWGLLKFNREDYRVRTSVREGETTNTYTIHLGGRAPTLNTYAATELDGEMMVFELDKGLYRDMLMYMSLPPPKE